MRKRTKPRESVNFKVTERRIKRYERATAKLFEGEGTLSMFLRRAADRLADEVLAEGKP